MKSVKKIGSVHTNIAEPEGESKAVREGNTRKSDGGNSTIVGNGEVESHAVQWSS